MEGDDDERHEEPLSSVTFDSDDIIIVPDPHSQNNNSFLIHFVKLCKPFQNRRG